MGVRNLAVGLLLTGAAVLGTLAVLMWTASEERAGVPVTGDAPFDPSPHVAPLATGADVPLQIAPAPRVEQQPDADLASQPVPRLLPSDAAQGRLLAHVTWADGRPAAGVVVELVEWAHWDPGRRTRTASTDAQGQLRFDDVLAGKVLLAADRGGQAEGEVFANEQTALELSIPDGRLVVGRVVDEEGAPQPGAAIWLSDQASGEGRLVAHSDAEGDFHIEAVSGPRYVGATLPPFAPSYLHDLSRDEVPDAPVLLVLRRAAGSLQGVVVDGGDAPVPGALVQVGGERGWPGSADRGRAGPPPRRSASDASGRFAFEALPIGPTQLLALAPGFTALSHDLTLATGTNGPVTLVLEPAGRVAGVVRDTSGRPIPEVAVSYGAYARFASAYTTSDEQGRYRLGGLPSGSQFLRAEQRAYFAQSLRITVTPGETTRWDPVLKRGYSIAGVVRDRFSGAPLEGWLVVSTPDSTAASAGSWTQESWTDTDGRFLLEGLEDRLHTVLVHEISDQWLAARGRVDAVAPGTDALVIEVDAREPGSVRGVLLDPVGEPVTMARVSLRSLDSGARSWNTAAGNQGDFELGSVAPGRYQLQIEARGCSPPPIDDVLVAPGVFTDVGTITLVPGGSLRVLLSIDPAVDAEQLRLNLPFQGLNGGALQRTGNEALSQPLAAGSYTLAVSGRGVASERRAIEIAEGRETLVDLTIRSGIDVPVTLRWSDGEQVRLAVELAVFDGDGELVSRNGPGQHYGIEELRLLVGLAPGDYRLVARDQQVSRAVRLQVGGTPVEPVVITME